jgi:hypothetical protein
MKARTKAFQDAEKISAKKDQLCDNDPSVPKQPLGVPFPRALGSSIHWSNNDAVSRKKTENLAAQRWRKCGVMTGNRNTSVSQSRVSLELCFW